MSKHLILGTAGHIDHGKTSLVKSLTGIDTDTLEEEKRRGITINLGYAHYDLADGTRIGVIDVPGHSRFIRTMLAGAAGIDFVLLVVAADDSVMPQTREHFDIVRLLGVRHGILVLTKTDLAAKDAADMAEAEVREMVHGSFLQNAALVRVSSVTGEGIPELKIEIEKLVRALDERQGEAPFRLPVDRSFSVAGFGTVVTGTVFSGSVRKGDRVLVLPGEQEAEVRGIEVHHQKSDIAKWGQRAALNLSGIDKGDVGRGDTVCAPGFFISTQMVDARFTPTGRSLLQGERVKFHLGTTEAEGRVYRLGESGLVQVRLSSPVAAVHNDRFILRDPAASATLGGGEVVDVHPLKHRRKKNVDAAALQALAGGSVRERVLTELGKAQTGVTPSVLRARLTEDEKTLTETLIQLDKNDKVVLLVSGGHSLALSLERWQAFLTALQARVSDFHSQNPLLNTGLPQAEVRQAALVFMGEEAVPLLDAFWTRLASTGVFRVEAGALLARDFRPAGDPEGERLKKEILSRLEKGFFSPPDKPDLFAGLPEKKAEQALQALLKGRAVLRLEACLFPLSTLEAGKENLRRYLAAHPQEGTVSNLRQLLNTSRKYALPLLNYYEAQGLLVRRGDLRVLA
ncbi:MAG: selenocysteine-specific translation elongation factor [Fibrobacterota bacterium]